MGNTIKNIATILGIATFAFGAYYLYVQKSTAPLDVVSSEQSMQTMLAKTSVFISHSQELDQISLDLSLLEDARFRSLQTPSAPLQEQPIGRPNPFAEGSFSGSSSE
jgi:hypothetical protein